MTTNTLLHEVMIATPFGAERLFGPATERMCWDFRDHASPRYEARLFVRPVLTTSEEETTYPTYPNLEVSEHEEPPFMGPDHDQYEGYEFDAMKCVDCDRPIGPYLASNEDQYGAEYESFRWEDFFIVDEDGAGHLAFCEDCHMENLANEREIQTWT